MSPLRSILLRPYRIFSLYRSSLSVVFSVRDLVAWFARIDSHDIRANRKLEWLVRIDSTRYNIGVRIVNDSRESHCESPVPLRYGRVLWAMERLRPSGLVMSRWPPKQVLERNSWKLSQGPGTKGVLGQCWKLLLPEESQIDPRLEWFCKSTAIPSTMQKLDVQQRRGFLQVACRVVYKSHPGGVL